MKESSRITDRSDLPSVSIILPIRNEVDFIERTLRSILQSDYPLERMEILVVDGMSDDGTREVIAHLAEGDNRIRLLDNPRRVVPTAMNLGIRSSKGKVIIRIDGHMIIEPNFVSEAIHSLLVHPDVWAVGGVMETVGASYAGRGIAAAMSSPVGVGLGNARVERDEEGYSDDVAFPAFRRFVFDKVGLFDEELIRNQDDDFFQRVKQAGGIQYFNPKIRSQYYSRATFGKLARQYYQYGFWRVRTIQKHKRPARFRQIAPVLFLAGWIVWIIAGMMWCPLLFGLGAYAGLYFLALIYGAVSVARRQGIRISLLVPLACAVMHFAYGLGTLKGIWSWIVLRGRFVPKPEEHSMSR